VLQLESLYPLLYVAIILVITYISTRIVRVLIRGIFRSGVPIVAIHAEKTTIGLIWIIGVLLVFETVGIRIDLLLLLLGVGAAAGIVAFKDTLQNLVAKYFSEVYLPFKLGDEITVLGHTGKVIGINPVCTILLDKEERIVSIPNSLFIKEPMVNLTQASWKEVIIPIVVPADIDLAEFEEAVLKSCNKLKMYWDENFSPFLTTKDRNQKNIRMELVLMVEDPERKEVAAAEMNKKVMEILQQAKKSSTSV
jgi:small-conductance mechanosensitive channel